MKWNTPSIARPELEKSINRLKEGLERQSKRLEIEEVCEQGLHATRKFLESKLLTPY
ncbi:hypothetical protein [Helicobacter suis]|uniref:hypothetical protein n=1 Tax=Helicobacter suis TaxID=104628 RepID=UPI0015969A9A|nr:hypothetical protein [Helicobacter suis]